MFGALKPALGHVSAECKKQYNSIYCNLCAALSASGAGAWNRFFLVNDVVTIDWLLAETDRSNDHAFACYNCLKGGVLGRKNKLPDRQRFLAAVSSYVCGVKINDNVIDDPKLKNKSLALVYRPIMKKAEATLREFNVLEPLQAYQTQNHHNEMERVTELHKACEPTEKCYELLTMEHAKRISNLPLTTAALLGNYLGRCVYLLDAINDMEDDKKKNQYNVLNQLSASKKTHNTKSHVIGDCLDFIKPLRLELTERLTQLPKNTSTLTLQKKWESLFISIDRQLFKLIKPFNRMELLTNLASFSTLNNHCSTYSPWSSITACSCCPCCSCCCPCCSCCEPCCGMCCMGCA